MKSQTLILSILTSAVIGFGCGGASTAAEEPTQPESAAGGDMTQEATMVTNDTGADEGMASGSSDGPSASLGATALGPQIGAGGSVRFNFKPTGRAKKIFLAGNFNGWDESAKDFLLADDNGDGIFSITIELDPGVYQYKFVIDGRWTKDPNSPASHPDGYGGQNGKFEVK